jgi:excisionase family DNA binding protein
MASKASKKVLCSVTEAAETLGVHPTTALRWAHKGKLRVVGKLAGETGSYVLDCEDVKRVGAERAKIADRSATTNEADS